MSRHLTTDLAATKAREGGLYQTFDLRPVLMMLGRRITRDTSSTTL
jgi:hypothetical protein